MLGCLLGCLGGMEFLVGWSSCWDASCNAATAASAPRYSVGILPAAQLGQAPTQTQPWSWGAGILVQATTKRSHLPIQPHKWVTPAPPTCLYKSALCCGKHCLQLCFSPGGDSALLDVLGFSSSLPSLLSRLPFNMLHLADPWWHPSPYVLVGLWGQALGRPSSQRSPRASRRAACYSLLIFRWGKTSWGSLLSAFCCSPVGFCLTHKLTVSPQGCWRCFSTGLLWVLQTCSPSSPPCCHFPGTAEEKGFCGGHDYPVSSATPLSICLERTFFSFPTILQNKPGLLPIPATSITHFPFLGHLWGFLVRVCGLPLLGFHSASNSASLSTTVLRLFAILFYNNEIFSFLV